MAVTPAPRFSRLARFSLTTADAQQLASFYVEAFGARHVSDTRLGGDKFRHMMGIECDARSITLRLGSEIIELVEFDVPGAPYPAHATACDTIFQHFAIVVSDITEAWFQLSRTPGWSPITHGTPQRLPDSSGGVTAFKFRDPEGHPLEFLSFPSKRTPKKWQVRQGKHPCLGIDHSAVVVSDAAASTEFYTSHGLHLSSQSHNAGPEQNWLDGLASAIVDVVGLAPAVAPPHVELLWYLRERVANATSSGNDIAATRLIFEADEATSPCQILDPDGHRLVVTPSSQLSRFP